MQHMHIDIRWLNYQRIYLASGVAAQPGLSRRVAPPVYRGSCGDLFIDEAAFHHRYVTLQDRLQRTPLPRQLAASFADHQEAAL